MISPCPFTLILKNVECPLYANMLRMTLLTSSLKAAGLHRALCRSFLYMGQPIIKTASGPFKCPGGSFNEILPHPPLPFLIKFPPLFISCSRTLIPIKVQLARHFIIQLKMRGPHGEATVLSRGLWSKSRPVAGFNLFFVLCARRNLALEIWLISEPGIW